jgi:lysophospholipase L1-like esterase
MSFVVPSERIHWHAGTGDSLSTRVRRFNLALIELARRIPISIVDVDDVVARAGAARVKLDTVHYNAAGYRAIAESVARVLADHGLFGQAS